MFLSHYHFLWVWPFVPAACRIILLCHSFKGVFVLFFERFGMLSQMSALKRQLWLLHSKFSSPPSLWELSWLRAPILVALLQEAAAVTNHVLDLYPT